ncbi:MAG: alpha/beta hydrolase [Bacteroidetes bacterium CHB5]|nr:alpha/beta hydrolase [Bacteroidetes bacterium CHB5]
MQIRLLLSKTIRPLIFVAVLFGITFLLDSCMQFRMSKSEIDHYFENKNPKAVLKSYYVGKRKQTYLINGDSLKPLVIFVHGSPGSLSAFIDFLADTSLLKSVRMISVDRPGFGSANFGYAEPSLEKQATLLKPILLAHRNNQPVFLIGHSLGGPLIAQMALDYPELIDGLVMVAPSIAPELEPNEWFRAPFATPFLKWMLPRSIRASNDEIYKLKPQLEALLPRWKDIRTPVIVIQGGKDSLVHPGNAEFAKRMMANTTVEIKFVEAMDHFVPWSNPELIREAIRKIAAK